MIKNCLDLNNKFYDPEDNLLVRLCKLMRSWHTTILIAMNDQIAHLMQERTN